MFLSLAARTLVATLNRLCLNRLHLHIIHTYDIVSQVWGPARLAANALPDILVEKMHYPLSYLPVCSDRLRLETKDHPIMLAEPNTQPRAVRETAVELLFEKFQTPALFLAKNAVLSSFASGRQTSLVIDMGYESSVGENASLEHHS